MCKQIFLKYLAADFIRDSLETLWDLVAAFGTSIKSSVLNILIFKNMVVNLELVHLNLIHYAIFLINPFSVIVEDG
jgi:hypothetical protein